MCHFLVYPLPTDSMIGNRRDARKFASRVGFWGQKQRKLVALLDALPIAPSKRTTDTVPFLAEYVRSESGARGQHPQWSAPCRGNDPVEKRGYAVEDVPSAGNHALRDKPQQETASKCRQCHPGR